MAPFALYGLGAIGAAAAGWLRYHSIKVGDLIKVKTAVLPATLKVVSITQKGLLPGKDDVIKANIVGDINGMTQAIPAPIMVTRGDVIENLSPRFL